MQIAIGNPIGYQSNAGGTAGVFGYLINDTFTTDRAAGSVNGTDAEPGPGRRRVTDDNNKLSLSGGAAVLATGGVGAGNPGIWYDAQARSVGLLLIAAVTPQTQRLGVGWDINLVTNPWDGIRFLEFANRLDAWANGVGIPVGVWVAGTEYPVAIALSATGAFHFAKIAGNWLLLWVSNAGTNATIYPAFAAETSAAVGTCQYLRVPATRWLPTPLASDGFSAWGTTDGLGHAEGIAGGLGAGGSGLAWTQHVGVWSASGGVATSTLVAGRALASVDCGTADVLVAVKLAVGANSAAISARYVDESNRLELRHTGAAIQFVKVIAGVSTTLINTASTFVPGAELRLSCIGTKFRVYYNNAFIGTEQTIADAAVASATRFGLRNTDVTNTFDDFTVYAIGTGGEYAILDTF